MGRFSPVLVVFSSGDAQAGSGSINDDE
ncbi:uncharacterized protein METZ01_LOCUS289180 [marine metagenome]|uniref:Uncharacterized protein n=1 Tax=marine metagenome TaxID=408172 RepID=A0A382LIC5_9ZZZZ